MQDYLSGRTWILIWVIVFGSMGAFFWLVFDGAMGNVEQRYYHLDVPGSMELPHLRSGHYFIYQEFDKSGDSKEDIRPAGFNRLTFTITQIEGGGTLQIKDTTQPSRFVIRRDVCEAVYEFDVSKAGAYRVNADYESGQTGGTYRTAIGQPYYIRALHSFLMGIALLVTAGLTVWFIFYRAGVLKQSLPSEPNVENE